MTQVDVVIATRDRRDRLLATLQHLRPCGAGEVIVVDNASGDGTPEAVEAACPWARVVRLPDNIGGAARNAGVAVSAAPYVAFSDDDSWWATGALARAAAVLDANPRLALLAALVLVGPEERLDPVSAAMATSGVSPRVVVRPSVLGFLACGAVVRRSPFLAVGGFDRRFGIGGEEELLAIDLRARGWELAYCDEVVAHHHPAGQRDPGSRWRRQARNGLWTAWLRRPVAVAATCSARALFNPAGRGGLRDAAAGWRWTVTHRRPAPALVEADLRRLARYGRSR
jgi:GT2 family glycosyltransferase